MSIDMGHYDEQAEARLIELIASRCAAEWVTDLHRVVPRLIQLLAESGEGHLHHLHPQVDLIVRDVLDAGECDSVSPDPHHVAHQVDQLLQAMAELRRERRNAGDWSAAPVPPIMFG